MKYRHLGTAGIQVSELSFGSWVTFHNQVGIERSSRDDGRRLTVRA